MMFPLVDMVAITRAELNRCLVAWEHKMGPLERPNAREWLYAMRHEGRPVAVVATSTLVREHPSRGRPG